MDLLLTDVAAEQHRVAGCGLIVGAPLDAEEADVDRVMLPARVRAAGDVDAQAADVGETFLLQQVADRLREATRLGHGEVARVGARAGDDVAGELGAGLGHADHLQPLVQDGQLRLGEVAEDDVLAVRQPDVRSELALDRRECPELVARDVAERRVRVRRDPAARDAAHDVRLIPASLRIA